ncbi:MAG: type VI secretion system baseplate subunit TssG [Gemmatimonadales bacterium]
MKMPDFVNPGRGACHTVDSAVPALLRLGIDVGRIVLRSAGTGWAAGRVVGQEPAPGSDLATARRIVLRVAGLGSLDSLPYPMRDSAEGEFRSDRLFALFDDHILKLGVHIRAAGGLLRLTPDDYDGAYRWITDIFGIPAEQWPRERWYDVARLLPSLPKIAGRADGPAVALEAVFGLPAKPVRTVAGVAPVAADRRTRLGRRNGRLGVDALVGDGVTAATAVEIEIGPVDLATYRRMQTPAERRQRDAIYRLLLPCHLADDVRERWQVGDRSEGATLGDPAREAALGLNAYLGGGKGRAA